MNHMQNIMKLVSSLMPTDVTPNNVVAEFINNEFGKLFGNNEDIQLIQTLAVSIANDNPNGVMEKLVVVANDIAAFVAELQNGEELMGGPSE